MLSGARLVLAADTGRLLSQIESVDSMNAGQIGPDIACVTTLIYKIL